MGLELPLILLLELFFLRSCFIKEKDLINKFNIKNSKFCSSYGRIDLFSCSDVFVELE